MNEREFWVQVRRGLLVVVDAIEIRWDMPRSADFKLQDGVPLRAAKHHKYEPPQTALARDTNTNVGA